MVRLFPLSTSKKLLNVTGKGYRTGLSLVLNANVEDYSVTSGKFDGFTVSYWYCTKTKDFYKLRIF